MALENTKVDAFIIRFTLFDGISIFFIIIITIIVIKTFK